MKTDSHLEQLQQKHTDNQAAQEKLAAEVAEIAKNAPAARSEAQNERLQVIEVERQKLVAEATTLAADIAKATKK